MKAFFLTYLQIPIPQLRQRAWRTASCVPSVARGWQGKQYGPHSQKHVVVRSDLCGGSLRTGTKADLCFAHLRLKWLLRWHLMKASKDTCYPQSPGVRDGGWTVERPKGLGKRRLRKKKILGRLMALKGCRIYRGIQNVLHNPRARCMLRKDVREP